MKSKELLIERINKIIQETSGINDELDYNVYSIAKEFTNYFQKNKNLKYDENGLKYMSKTIKKEIFNKNFNIECTCVYFDSKNDYQNYISKYGDFPNGFVDLKKYFYIKVFLISINGNFLYDDFYDSIYHEIEHPFQVTMMGKEFGGTDLNAYIRSKINSNNRYERIIAETIYATRHNEQDAMVNGMWDYIKYNIENDENFNGRIDKYIVNNEASIWLMKLYKNYAFILNNKDNQEFINALEKYRIFNINYGRLISIVKYGIKRFEDKIALVTRKLKQRYIKEYHVHLDFKSNRILDEGKKQYCLTLI